MLAIYLFNLAGYYFIFFMIIYQSDQELVERLDQSQYNNEDLVHIKIPLSLPYCNNQTDYERVDGEINYNGVYYSYVKRKLANDTLHILCLPNEAKTKLHGVQTEYAKNTNDLPLEKHSTSGKKANGLSEHNAQLSNYSFMATLQSSIQTFYYFSSRLYCSFLKSNFHPPEVNASLLLFI